MTAIFHLTRAAISIMMAGMRALLMVFLLLSPVTYTMAERNKLKPTDFEPLTSLPWEKPDATIESVLDAIFREPNLSIRYPLLAEYLRAIHVVELNKTFDLCIDLEGTQTPNDLVEFFLPVWAERDPLACWERTKELFQIVGIDDGWLSYDSWGGRERITMQDLSSIRASRFWLERKALLSFPGGIEKSALPKEERLQILKEFADVWFRAFASWPGYPRPAPQYSYARGYSDVAPDLVAMFSRSVEELRRYVETSNMSRGEAAFMVAARRWLEADPASAPEILKRAKATKWPPDQHFSDDPVELFILWAKADLAAMIQWTESLDLGKDDFAMEAREFLMSRVEAGRRERWFAEAKLDEDNLHRLLEVWAEWDPKVALDAAVATDNSEMAEEVANVAASGHWPGAWNTSHFGFGVIKEFDARRLPESYHNDHFTNWEEIMEQWGEIDIGEAARYGLDFLLRNDYAPPEGLMSFFSGKDVYPDEGGMIDRTFCSMRVWAVVKPNEMKAWIATQKDAEMRKALTWLLEHPWGGPPASDGQKDR